MEEADELFYEIKCSPCEDDEKIQDGDYDLHHKGEQELDDIHDGVHSMYSNVPIFLNTFLAKFRARASY